MHLDVHSILLPSLLKNLLIKTVCASCYLKLSLLMFLKCFLIIAYFQPYASYRHVTMKKRVIANF